MDILQLGERTGWPNIAPGGLFAFPYKNYLQLGIRIKSDREEYIVGLFNREGKGPGPHNLDDFSPNFLYDLKDYILLPKLNPGSPLDNISVKSIPVGTVIQFGSGEFYMTHYSGEQILLFNLTTGEINQKNPARTMCFTSWKIVQKKNLAKCKLDPLLSFPFSET